ncbi:unnamed protein product [Orchesella dallaii]|uniref:Uncharacterized protein n=1 Tax=Orchesella dallaii TaxID=48710 RepID=A0ABP1S801_9HEXA
MVLVLSRAVLKVQIQVGQSLNLLPYEWVENTSYFKSKNNNTHCKINMSTFFMIYLLSTGYYLSTVSKSNESYSFRILATFFAMVHMCAINATWFNIKSSNILPQLWMFRTTDIMAKSGNKNPRSSSLEICSTLGTLLCNLIVPTVFPLVTILFPCRLFYSNIIAIVFPAFCKSTFVNVMTYVSEVTLLGVAQLILGVQVIVFSITVQTWNQNLKAVKLFCKAVNNWGDKTQWDVLRLPSWSDFVPGHLIIVFTNNHQIDMEHYKATNSSSSTNADYYTRPTRQPDVPPSTYDCSVYRILCLGFLLFLIATFIKLIWNVTKQKNPVVPQMQIVTQEQQDRRMFHVVVNILRESNPPSYDQVLGPTNPTLQRVPGHLQIACVDTASLPTYEESVKNGKQSQFA